MNTVLSKLVALTAVGLLVAACGNDLSGNVYAAKMGDSVNSSMTATFEDDRVEMMGALTPYEIDGDRILVGPEGMQQVWTMQDDGSIDWAGGTWVPIED